MSSSISSRIRRAKMVVTAYGVRLLLAVGTMILVAGVGLGVFILVRAGSSSATQPPAPLSANQQQVLLQGEQAKDDFNGTILGWRFAPDSVLAAEGFEHSSSFDCTADVFAADAPSTLDVSLTYLPSTVDVANAGKPDRVVCTDGPRSYTRMYPIATAFGESTLAVQRLRWTPRKFPLEAAEDRVSSGTINGQPAVFVKPVDLGTNFGRSEILVIEDDTLDPYATVLHLYARDIAWAELLRIAEGAR